MAVWLVATLALAGISCSTLRRSGLQSSETAELTRNIIADQMNYWIGSGDSIGDIYVDAMLLERYSLFGKQVFIKADDAYPGLLDSKRVPIVQPFRIPDKLINRVKYLTPAIDVENGHETVFFFSPLIPTTQKDKYAIQVLTCYSMDAGYTFLRTASMSFHVYSITKNAYTFLYSVPETSEMVSLPLLRVK